MLLSVCIENQVNEMIISTVAVSMRHNGREIGSGLSIILLVVIIMANGYTSREVLENVMILTVSALVLPVSRVATFPLHL